MAVSSATQSMLNGKRRTAGEHFDSEVEAMAHMADLKRAGARNIRKAKWLDYRKPDGTKVFKWTVRCDA